MVYGNSGWVVVDYSSAEVVRFDLAAESVQIPHFPNLGGKGVCGNVAQPVSARLGYPSLRATIAVRVSLAGRCFIRSGVDMISHPASSMTEFMRASEIFR